MTKKIWLALGGLIAFSFAVPVCFAAPRPPMSPFPTQRDENQQMRTSQLFKPFGKIANLIAQKKKKEKKSKHNYRTLISTTISGDQNNSDYTVTSDYSGGDSSSDYYRKIPVSGLRISNPFAYNLMSKVGMVEGLNEEAWGEEDNYLVTEGNLWAWYGWGSTTGGVFTYNDYGAGDYRCFTYNGGTEKKVRKNPAYKLYSFTISGNENNADAAANPYVWSPESTYYYRRLDIPNLNLTNLMDYRIFRKDTSLVNGQESWIPVDYDYFVADGSLYVAYGDKYGNSDFYNTYTGDFRVFIYSNGKKKKKKLTKQYVKRYILSAASGAGNADKTLVFSDTDFSQKEYYKKFAIPGLKMVDYPNLRVLNKSTFNAGIGVATWVPSSFFVTDGYIWVNFGYDDSENGGPYTYYNLGEGEYRIFLYK
jgi:hypothetical protein